MGNYSFIYSANILILVLLLILIYSFSKEIGTSNRESLFLALLIGSIPVVANYSATAKPDIFTTFLIILSSYYLLLLFKYKNYRYLLLAFIAAILSYGGKPTSIAYTSILLLSFSIYTVILLVNKKLKSNYLNFIFEKKEFISLIPVTITAIFVFLGITFRTYLLTGYPFYKILTGLWNYLGLNGKYPYIQTAYATSININVNKFEIFDKLKLWFEVLFKPNDLPHIIIAWTGNSLLFLLVLILLFVLSKKNKFQKHHIVLIPFIPVVLFGVFYLTTFSGDFRGGDGNYYLVPLILSMILMYSFLMELLKITPKKKTLVVFSLTFFVLFQSLYMFISHSSWAFGTSPISFNIFKSFNYTEKTNTEQLKNYGVYEIQKYILSNSRFKRAFAIGDESILNRLACRVEAMNTINHFGGNLNIVASEGSFVNYLEWAKIDYIIAPKIINGGYTTRVIDKLKKLQNVKKIQDRDFILLDIKGINLKELSKDTSQETDLNVSKSDLVYDFYEQFNQASKGNVYDFGAPWGKSIANIKVNVGTDNNAIFIGNGSEISFDVDIPQNKKIVFQAYIGYHPAARTWNVSDGVRFRLDAIISQDNQINLINEYIMPNDEYKKILIPLDVLNGKKVTFKFYTQNDDKGNDAGDWPIWINPQVYSTN